MKTRVLRASLAVVCFCIMHNVYTQTLQIHYTYFTDSTSIGQETRQRVADLLVKLGEVLDHPDISTSLPIDVVFLHPDYLGSLQFKDNAKHNAQQNFVQWWNSQYDNSLRLLFFFEKVGSQYQFKVFEATPAVRDMQLPDLVYNYINEQIIAPHTNEPKEAVYWGLNAVKNAFDRRFMERLVEWGPRLLEFSYYYKGYSYITHPYYYFEYETTSRTGSISHPLSYYHEGNYYPVYFQGKPTQRALVFDHIIGHPLTTSLGSNNNLSISSTNSQNLYTNPSEQSYTLLSSINLNFQKENILNFEGTPYSNYDALPNGGLKTLAQYLVNSQRINTIEPNPSNQNRMHINEGDIIRSNGSYRIYAGSINGFERNLSKIGTPVKVDSISPKMGWSVNWWNGFSFSQPTWCNVFAMDLSYKVFGLVDGDSPVPYGDGNNNANKLNEIFKGKEIDFINITSLRVEYHQNIWGQFINKGFPVYFSSLGLLNSDGSRRSGHIETAFPSNISGNKSNKTYFNSLPGSNVLKPSSEHLSIGAGTYTGFKSYNEFSFLNTPSSDIFVYLGYLRKVYDE